MCVSVLHIVPSKSETNPFNFVKLLHALSKFLPKIYDPARKCRWQIIKIIEMFLRDNLQMTSTNGGIVYKDH